MSTTPKQTRELYKKIRYHWLHLQKALNEAQAKGIISFDRQNYADEAPNKSSYELSYRIDITTREALAEAFRKEIDHQINFKW